MTVEIAVLIPAIWGLAGLAAVLFVTRAPRPRHAAEPAEMDELRRAA